ncbi:DUF2244 domain-containing protein [Aureimonas fodinaquatilis]|uniref:DUF2244 domain-containing protein n=1 Tax=Aureimonas fodinaquatilis TaxID=2565783 RepID=A0A5B0E170_9HYPH|nr:DUF2244 domain-containing protein [Aureimonas fodinaquatilis]KAA0971711.1 DUF2244 domain-containing protein [Aureimonas fodinaquatilis]
MHPEEEPNINEQLLFRALLTPYRSLGKLGFTLMMLTFGFVSLVTGLVFLSHGAWPVFGYFGLDVLLLWLAFRYNNRAALASEEVSISRTLLLIRKTSPRGKVQEITYNPFWTRFDVRRHHEYGVTHMAVSGSGNTTEIGAFLNPEDRETFATEFGRALATTKLG